MPLGRRPTGLVIVLVLAAGTAACAGASTPTAPATSVIASVFGAARVTKLTVTGTNPVIGTSSPFSATATLSDGTTLVVTSLSTWQSTNAVVATVAVGGLVTGAGAGNTEIR